MRRRQGILGAAVLAACTAASVAVGAPAAADDRGDPHGLCLEAGLGGPPGIAVRVCAGLAPHPAPAPADTPRTALRTAPEADEPDPGDPEPEPEYPSEPGYPGPGYPTAPAPPYPTTPPPPTPTPPKPPTPRPPVVRPVQPPPQPRPRPYQAAVPPEAVPTPSPTPTPTPRPVVPSAAPGVVQRQLVLDRFAERRRGTDRRLVILVVFTGVISVTAVSALNARARR
ncbi:hypothetical protein AB0J63_08365 [Streptosporangium canum]|uniref:hypothetical protein n=1 Tax=Streptosporangium canum TaxID=324952 RepID=UPI0034167278